MVRRGRESRGRYRCERASLCVAAIPQKVHRTICLVCAENLLGRFLACLLTNKVIPTATRAVANAAKRPATVQRIVPGRPASRTVRRQQSRDISFFRFFVTVKRHKRPKEQRVFVWGNRKKKKEKKLERMDVIRC